MKCPRCNSQYIVKNGHTHTGKQNFKCRDCDRQFVMAPRHQPVEEETRKLIDRLLLEKISLAGIVRATICDKLRKSANCQGGKPKKVK